MTDSYEIHISKAEHVFSAAHFITFGNNCERLHGHNYHIAAEIAGPLDESHLVIDFLMVRAKLLKIAAELDHYVLLPTQHPKIRVEKIDQEVIATFEERRWVFPAGDCRLLPVPNTTSELLATHIGKKLFEALGGAAAKIQRMDVSVDECDGQIGVWKWRPDAR